MLVDRMVLEQGGYSSFVPRLNTPFTQGLRSLCLPCATTKLVAALYRSGVACISLIDSLVACLMKLLQMYRRCKVTSLKVPIHNKSAQVQVIAWLWTGYMTINVKGAILLTSFNFNPSISNYIHYNVWDEINCKYNPKLQRLCRWTVW